MGRFLGFVALLVLSSAAAHADWHFRRTLDPMTDEARGVLMRASDNSKGAIALRCGKSFSDDGLDIMIDVKLYLAGETTTFKYRFDSEEPKTASGSHDSGDTMVFVPDAIEHEFVKKMKLSSRLTIQVAPYREGLKTLTFNLNGFTKTFNEACAGLL